jgi:hypothetical protein
MDEVERAILQTVGVTGEHTVDGRGRELLGQACSPTARDDVVYEALVRLLNEDLHDGARIARPGDGLPLEITSVNITDAGREAAKR